MADFSGLALDGAKIADAIKSFSGNLNGEAAVSGKGYDAYTVNLDGQDPALLHVYKRADGRFTLQFKVGKNQGLSEAVAKHVAENCACDPIQTKTISLKHISEEDWAFLRESLAADGLALTDEALLHGKRVRVAASDKDQVRIHRYDNGRFLLQGRTRIAYSAVVNALNYTGTDRKDLIESQMAVVPVTVASSGQLLGDLEQRIPTAWSKMDETLRTILAPALLVHKLSADLPDYSLMVFPALRGMEGCIKDLFARKGYYLGPKLSLGDQFDAKTKAVAASVKPRIANCVGTCQAAEMIYQHFSANRNGLLHVDSVVATTRIIEKQSEAAEIVDTALFVIEKAYETAP